MICKVHNVYYRVGKCHKCVERDAEVSKTMDEISQLDREIRALERENADISLVLWENN